VAGGAVDIGAVETGSLAPDLLLVVDTLADEDDGVAAGGVSLRDAIAAAAPGAFVTFAPELDHGVISLSGPELVISKDLDLDASALPSGIALTRGTVGRIFRVDSGNRVALAGLTLRDSENDDGPGGAIRNAGTLSLTACKVLGCVNIDDEGGGIHNDGSLSLAGCVIAGNLSLRGGGICNSGILDLVACKIQGNIGDDGAGGFCNRRSLSLEDCTISDNFSQGGGGIGNYGGNATLGMNACTLDGNYGQVLGGGLENINATALVTNCTFHDNSADAGGGIGNQGGILTVAACTVAGNRAEYSGGGIANALSPSRFTLRNTIVAGNTAGDETTDIAGRIDTQAGVNLVTSANGITPGFSGIVADPLLSPPANHGGPTRTMLPLAGSPAIDAGASNTLPKDQRGFWRVVGSAVDLGAVETGNAIPGLVVDTAADQDDGDPSDGLSLREAIDRAGEGARITFAPALDGLTSTLVHGQLSIAKDLDVDASSLSGGITVSAGNLSRVFRIEATSSVTLDALVLRGGNAADGGGLLNEGSLALDGCTLAENQATRGGGLFTATGTTTTLTASAVTGNWAGDSAGGIRNHGTTTATACRIEGNAAPSSGGIGNTGTMTLHSCSIIDNFATSGSAGGILNLGTMTLLASTLSENTAVSRGGGIYNNGGSLALTTCTVAGNLAMFDSGGGIAAAGGTTLSASTIAGNTARFWGGGIHVGEGAPLVLKNSIVADNGTMMGSPDIHGSIATQAGVNLVSSSDGIAGTFAGLVADPRLAALGLYGGPTATLAPLPGSPVIEAAVPLPGDPATDQTGAARPRGPLPDIGAMEAVAFSTLSLADTDSDGIPDLVEGAYPQLSVGVDDSALDSDGDGSSDAEELAGMTDPGDGTDFLRVTAFAKAPGFDPAANPVFTLSFTTFPGLVYALEADQDLDFSGADHRILLPPFTATDYHRTTTVTLLPGRDFIRAVRDD
jgi:CSLREA domain-containing protein